MHCICGYTEHDFDFILTVIQKLLPVIMSRISLKENGGEVSATKDYTNGGGVRDLYGEDSATEDHLITPWTFSVARYHYLTFYMSKKTTWNLSFVAFSLRVWICGHLSVILLMGEFHFWLCQTYFLIIFKKGRFFFFSHFMAFLDYVLFGVLGSVDHQIVDLFDDIKVYEAVLLTYYV